LVLVVVQIRKAQAHLLIVIIQQVVALVVPEQVAQAEEVRL
jgi:hypothetical protein